MNNEFIDLSMELFSKMIRKFEEKNKERGDEWKGLSLIQILKIIDAKVKKMRGEFRIINKTEIIITPNMFEDDVLDLLVWGYFLNSKTKEFLKAMTKEASVSEREKILYEKTGNQNNHV